MKRTDIKTIYASWIALASMTCALSLPALASQAAQKTQSGPSTGVNATAPKKTPKQLLVLDKAWQLRSASTIKKLAFIEQLQKDIDNQNHTLENQSRMMVAQSVLLLSEENLQFAAAEIFRKAAELSPLKLNKQTAVLIWNEFQQKAGIYESSNYSALADVAWALAGSGHSDIEQNWNFFVALSEKNRGNSESALNWLDKVDTHSNLYRQARLHEGLLSASLGKLQKAKISLETALSLEKTESEKKAGLKDETLVQIKEHAALNLARLMFETREFKESLVLYRSIDSQSPLFYESLSEQGWAFFLAGHPNRALGAEYGAASPFFNNQFQPDLYFLSAAVNYWLCDFKAARRNIQSFVLHTKEDANLLRKWTLSESPSQDEYQQLLKKSFTVANNLYHGVSSTNNLLGPRGLQTLSRKANILRSLSTLENMRATRLNVQSGSWPVRSKRIVAQALLNREEQEQKNIGRLTLAVIDAMRSDYERALTQLRLIHLEIMTAEKDKLMNRERSSTGQEFMGTEAEFLESAQQSAQVWNNEKREFWKDELDSFVFKKTSQCQSAEGEVERHAEK